MLVSDSNVDIRVSILLIFLFPVLRAFFYDIKIPAKLKLNKINESYTYNEYKQNYHEKTCFLSSKIKQRNHYVVLNTPSLY